MSHDHVARHRGAPAAPAAGVGRRTALLAAALAGLAAVVLLVLVVF